MSTKQKIFPKKAIVYFYKAIPLNVKNIAEKPLQTALSSYFPGVNADPKEPQKA